MLNFDKLDDYQDYLVQVRNTKTGEVLEGLLDNDELSYTTSADIGSNFLAGYVEDMMRGAAQGLTSKLPVVGGLARDAVKQNYKTVKSTYKAYEGASATSFSVSFHLFAKNESYNSILQKLHKLTQPDTEDSEFMHSYLYNPTDSAALLIGGDPFAGNLIHVSIGDWFLATGLFCNSVSHSFSKYVDTEGKPIYLSVTLGFEPYKVLNATELASWVKR